VLQARIAALTLQQLLAKLVHVLAALHPDDLSNPVNAAR